MPRLASSRPRIKSLPVLATRLPTSHAECLAALMEILQIITVQNAEVLSSGLLLYFTFSGATQRGHGS